jgi:hypothetical protein
MSRWADPVSAVGIRLVQDDSLHVVAPHGMADVFGLVVRPHLVAPNAAAVYRERMATKRWAERWPRLKLVPLPKSFRCCNGVRSTNHIFNPAA